MEYGNSLLFYSLIQVSNITSAQERKYWKQGVLSLRDLSENIGEQLSLFTVTQPNEIQQLLTDSGKDVQHIADLLAKKTGKKDFYRIAYSVPEDVMFVDIETTGLSQEYHYITVIGWMLNGEYNFWLNGTDPTSFISACKTAKMIVTFNGTRFDLKFIDRIFPQLHITTKPHLDLLHFCRRFNLTQGQKAIEQELGFVRPEDVGDCNGKEAIALWYKFLFGEDSALYSLIRYNCYDVVGMTYILDKVFFGRVFGKEFPKLCKPSRFYRARRKYSIVIPDEDIRATRQYASSKNFDCRQLSVADEERIVGIDLAGVISKSSNTGICLLKGNNAITKAIKTDDEIIRFIVDAEADLISIDAPLSLPSGRTSVYNDDPKREEAGIMRYSERLLHSRGVNSYPALIDSMQELTKRGINLAQRLRKMGYPVIECFPGAAQDILQLPRKKTDLSLLKTGLARLGIEGDYQNGHIIHDELDAITAAIVGKFFIAEYFEPIGIPEENYMIVPSTSKADHSGNVVIGFAGHIASGKTTAAKFIESNGYMYCRYSQIIAQGLTQKGVAIDRQSLQMAGSSLFNGGGQYLLNKKMDEFLSGNKKVVIDGMRHFEDYTYWKEKYYHNFLLVYINTDLETRSSRSSEKVYKDVDAHPAEQEVDGLRNLADIVLTNDGTLDEFYNKLKYILDTIDLKG